MAKIKENKMKVDKNKVIKEIEDAYEDVENAKNEYDDYETGFNLGYAEALERILLEYGNLTANEKNKIIGIKLKTLKY